MIPNPRKPYLLFDAGGVLVFPNHALLAEIARQFDIEVTAEKLWEAHCQMFYAADVQARVKGNFSQFLPNYFYMLYEFVGAEGNALKRAAELAYEHDQRISGWTSTRPWVSETLDQLASLGFRMSVISNSDGRVNTILSDLGLRDHFESVFDSYKLGVEKPDPRIFQIALKSLELEPSAAIYIGDVYSIDVLGANQVGLGAIQMDALGLYHDWPGVHLPDIRHLIGWLPDYAEADLFPL